MGFWRSVSFHSDFCNLGMMLPLLSPGHLIKGKCIPAWISRISILLHTMNLLFMYFLVESEECVLSILEVVLHCISMVLATLVKPSVLGGHITVC